MKFAAGLMAGIMGGGAPWPSPQEHSHGDPADDEQYVLEVINRARADPFAEGARLGVDAREGLTPLEAERVGPRPPLAFNAALIDAARAHSRDMHARNFFEHVNPDGDDSGTRAAHAGYFWNRIGENIAAGSNPAIHTAAHLQDLLFVDAGIEGRGHRTNLMDVSEAVPPAPVFREVGLGYVAFEEPNATGFRVFFSQEFGRRAEGPFLVGVVLNDTNGNGFYDPGEGVRGIRLGHDRGTGWAVTSGSGGYACPVEPNGVVTVTPSGGGVSWAPSVVKKARVQSENVKIDFKTSDAVDTDTDGMPDAWELQNGFNPSSPSDAALDLDGDGMTNLEEFQFGTVPGDASSRLGAPPPPAPPPEGEDSNPRCGLLGLDLLVSLVVLLRRMKRFLY